MKRRRCWPSASLETVVERAVRLVVSAEGGGGREVAEGTSRMVVARQRKHSPLPKYEGAG